MSRLAYGGMAAARAGVVGFVRAIRSQMAAISIALMAGGIELTVDFNAKNPITSLRRKELPKHLADLAKGIDQHRSGPVDADLFQVKGPRSRFDAAPFGPLSVTLGVVNVVHPA